MTEIPRETLDGYAAELTEIARQLGAHTREPAEAEAEDNKNLRQEMASSLEYVEGWATEIGRQDVSFFLRTSALLLQQEGIPLTEALAMVDKWKQTDPEWNKWVEAQPLFREWRERIGDGRRE